MNEELKKYYEYLKSVKADIPDTFESFAETLADETQAKTYFDYLKSNKFDTPDTFESFSDTFGLKKKDISEDIGIPSETSLTPQQPSESVNISDKIDALIANKESARHPLLQPADVTSVDIVTRPLPKEEVSPKPQTLREYMSERHVTPKIMGLPKGINLDRLMDEGEKENYDDLLSFKGFYQKPQKPSYFWGTVKSVNLGTASFFQSLDNAAKTLSNMTGLRSGGAFGDIAEYLKWHESFLPDTPDTRAGRLLSNIGGLNGLFLELAITPEFKLKMLGKIREVPKIITSLMGTGFVNRYAENITGEEPTGKEMIEGLKGAGVGLKDGAILVGLGYTSGVLGELVKTATKSGLAGTATGMVTTAVGFGGADAIQQLVTTGNIDWKQTEQSFDLGLAFGIPELARYAGMRAWNNFITASPQALDAAKKFNISPAEARKKAIDIRTKAKEETDIEKRASMEAMADVMDALTDIKLVRNGVAKDPTLYKKVINNDAELTVPEKEFYNKQIDAITTEDISTPPIRLAQNELKALNEDLANIETKLTPVDPIIDAQTKLIKEQIKKKQEVLSNLISGKIPEEIRFAGESFASKEDAFKWLDDNYNRKEKLASASEVETASDFGVKVFNEWYDKNAKELSEKGFGKNLKELKKEIDNEVKTKEETKDAERIREETESTGEQAQGVVEGEEGGLRVRDTEKDRLEAEQGEEVKITQEGNIFNKQQVIESLLTEVPEESKEMMRTEFERTERDEFNKMAEQAGFNNFGSYWTRETIAKESEQPVQKPEEFTESEQEGEIEQKVGAKSILNQKTDLLGDEKEEAMNPVVPKIRQKVGDNVKFKDSGGNIREGNYRGIGQDGRALIDVQQTTDGKKYYTTSLVPIKDVEFPKILPTDQISPIEYAIENGLYQEWIREGRITANDAKSIIESAILDVPQEILDLAPKEAISEEIPESEGVVPPPPEKIVETPEIAPEGKKRAGFEKRETKKGTRGSIEMRRDEIGKIVKRIIDDNPHFYAQTTRQEEIGKAKEFISSFASFDNVYSNLVKKTKNIDELTMRHVARQVMLQKLGEDLRDSMKDGSKEESDAIADKIINLDDITQKEIRISATTLAMTLWQFMTPEATVFMLNKVINEQNRTRLGFEAKQAEEFIGEWGKEAPESIKRLIKENPELRDFIEKIQAKTGRIPPTHRVTKAKAKEIANKVRSLKSSNWGLTFADPIGATAILDGALEVTARTIETTGNLLQAIQDGISEIKKSGWYKSLTNQKQKEVEGTFGKKVRENVDFDAAEYIEGQSWYREAEKPAVTEEEKVQKKEAQKTIAEADKKLREQIFDVIASHWLVEKISDKTLVDKLVEEVGLTKHEAEKIANISEEAVRRDSQKVFEATLGKKIVNTNTRKSAFEKFFNLIKRGVLTNENYYEVFADKYKLKKGLTEEEKIAIQKLAINAQQMASYGYYGDLAFNEFLQYMAKVSEQDSWLERQGKLMVAVNYASILMGVTTHKVNLTSAGANLLIRPFLGVANPVKWADVGIKLMQGKTREAHLKNPLAALCYASQAYRIGGIIGGTTALNIIKHGNIKESSKYMEAVNNLSGQEIPELEKSTFGVGKRFRPWDKFRFKIGNKAFLGDLNPWNAFKYSGRTLLAEDAAMFNEAFALELALAARREAIIGNIALSPSQLRKKILNEIAGMYLTDEQVTAVEQQLEEQTQMLRMSGTEPTSLQIKQRRFELTRSLLDLKPEMEEELTQLGRGEIFTGKRGGVFSTIGDALGGLFSKHVLIKLATLPKIPFTGVLGRIADYSIDTMPGYGVIRSEGWSPTGIIARARQWNRSGQFSDFMTAPAKYGMFKSAQMGARGTPAHERQMARHYFGLVLLSGAAAVFLRDDDDIEKDKDGHPVIDITGGLHYNTWDEKEHHYLGAYTVRLGGWKFRFLNFPILNAPLAIIGNYKDAVRAGEDNDDLWARLSLLGAAWFRSLGLIKDTWLAKGINDLFELMGGLMASVGGGEERRKRVKAEEGVEIVDIDGRVQRQLENLRDDYTGLPIKYIDPLKSNLLQQVIKFTTPESRLKGTGLQLWAYNVGLQWWNDKRTDIFGQEVKTLPGDQGTAWPRVSDKRWEKMWKYNIHVQDVTSRDKLVIKGIPQTLEWDQYIERKKLTQELFRDRFDKYFTETTPAILGRKATTEITEGEYKTNRIDKDIRDVWSKTKSDVNKYMFVWDKYVKKDPVLFNFLMKEGLLPDFYKPEIKDDLGYNIIFPYDKLEKFNDKIMKGFIPQIKEYLKGKSNADIEKLKSGINEKTGKSYLEDDIDYYYSIEKDYVNKDVKDELMIW